MPEKYLLSFTATRLINPEEMDGLTKRLTKMLQEKPFGPWKPGFPDHPLLSNITVHKEIDPLLGYDKAWLIQALLDHLRVQEKRILAGGINSLSLQNLQFTLARIDEFSGETVPGLDDLRKIAKNNVY